MVVVMKPILFTVAGSVNLLICNFWIPIAVIYVHVMVLDITVSMSEASAVPRLLLHNGVSFVRPVEVQLT